ncbi:PAS domain-containing protein [Catalinimonas sp. 4WD22]|uniref:PAS domain-containing protein n=1 Tax=Catalinimonas locisalis TaxID=3133978 RepID=UPI003101080F
MPKEEPSEEVQQVLYHLSENANQVFFAFDLDESRFIYLNQYFEELWQMSREEITHDPSKLLSTVHPEDQEVVKNFYLRNLKESGEKQSSIEFRLLLSDKSVR